MGFPGFQCPHCTMVIHYLPPQHRTTVIHDLPPQHYTELTWKDKSFTATSASHWHATVVPLVSTAWSQPMHCKLDMSTTEAK